ncbi:hypothetical protein Patl1_35777 [Pistacia atlantica]|nr:hypothetical protein Patl1_35777 [Pistacia atlantica]
MRDSDCLYNTGEAPSEKSLKTKGKQVMEIMKSMCEKEVIVWKHLKRNYQVAPLGTPRRWFLLRNQCFKWCI